LFSEHNNNNISLLRENYVVVVLGYSCDVIKDKACILDTYPIDNTLEDSLGYSYFFNNSLDDTSYNCCRS